MGIAVSLHLLGTIIWVGGMFFAHMVLRPSLEGTWTPAQRLPLMQQVLRRFFRWVWFSLIAILVSGYWIFFVIYQSHTQLFVHLMEGAGLLMVLLFLFVYSLPYRHMGQALKQGDFAEAGRLLRIIRIVIGINLALGLSTALVGVSGRYW